MKQNRIWILLQVIAGVLCLFLSQQISDYMRSVPEAGDEVSRWLYPAIPAAAALLFFIAAWFTNRRMKNKQEQEN